MHPDDAAGSVFVVQESPVNPPSLWRRGTALQRRNGPCNGNVFQQMGAASADVLNYAFYS